MKKTPKKNTLIKSRQRVRDHGEVFTPEHIVKDMCNLIPQDVWNNITATFLEPCAGTGNILVEIYARKLRLCKDTKDGLKALASMVGIDIMPDNVTECRSRLKKMFLDKFPEANEFCRLTADLILKNNIICGDSLEIMKKWQAEEEQKAKPQQLDFFDILDKGDKQ